MQRQTQADRQAERESQNALLRAYGYHWRRFETLTQEQEHHWFQHLSAMGDDRPAWVLLSPLDMPVRDTAILRWLGKHGSSSEDVLAFLNEHGFIVQGKDERQIWRIQTPSAKETINLKQALQELERIRIDQANARERAREQKLKEDFEKSAASLKAALDSYGTAQNDAHAWGYSPYPYAKRVADGTIEVTTYHFESEWHTATFKTEAEVVYHLYSNEDGYWDPGEWAQQH